MIDRYNKRIYVGWAEHEVLWLHAAMELGRAERGGAFQDIADLTGRTFAQVARQAQKHALLLRERDRQARMAAERAGRTAPPPTILPLSMLNVSPRTMAMRMGARA